MASGRQYLRVTTPQAAPAAHPQSGPNIKRMAGWRERLIAAADGRTYRQIAEKTLGLDGRPLAHSTVRGAFLGSGGVQLETLSCICDALGVDVVSIIGGSDILTAAMAKNVLLPPATSVAATPIVKLEQASHWDDIAADPRRYEDVYFGDPLEALTARAAVVTNNQMAPTLTPGDVVVYRAGEPYGGALVLCTIAGTDMAICRKWGTRGDRVVLTCDNADYGSQTIARDRVNVIGVVHKVIKNISK